MAEQALEEKLRPRGSPDLSHEPPDTRFPDVVVSGEEAFTVIGAIAGGFVIAFSELMVTFAYKKVAAYLLPYNLVPDGLLQLLSTDYKFSVSFMILIIVLL